MEDAPSELKGHEVQRSAISLRFLTESHPAAFWESLGRAVGTFAQLEKLLKQAFFALTGTVPAPANPAQQRDAVDAWTTALEHALVAQLYSAAERFIAAAKRHPLVKHPDLDEFGRMLKAAARLRNVVCHAAWDTPSESGGSRGFFITGEPGKQEAFDTLVTVEWLDQLSAHTAELAFEVVNVVTRTGYTFPGSNGPGRPL